jgi:hypothetical protein
MVWTPAPDFGSKGMTALELYRLRQKERNRKVVAALTADATNSSMKSNTKICATRSDPKQDKPQALSSIDIDRELENIRMQEERIIQMALDRQKVPLVTKGCFFCHEVVLRPQSDEILAKQRHDFFVPPKPSKEELALRRSQALERLSRPVAINNSDLVHKSMHAA